MITFFIISFQKFTLHHWVKSILVEERVSEGYKEIIAEFNVYIQPFTNKIEINLPFMCSYMTNPFTFPSSISQRAPLSLTSVTVTSLISPTCTPAKQPLTPVVVQENDIILYQGSDIDD